MTSPVPIIFGSTVLVALILCILGIVKNKTWLVILGAVLFFPFVYYFGGSPNTRIILVLPFLLFGSAYAVSKNNKMLAWSLFSPVIVFVLFILGIVLIYNLGN